MIASSCSRTLRRNRSILLAPSCYSTHYLKEDGGLVFSASMGKSSLAIGSHLSKFSTLAARVGEKPGLPVPTLAISPLEIARLPPLRFAGRVVVVSMLEDEQRVESFFAEENLLGFDSESRPSGAFATKNRTAVIQVATKKAVCVWRVSEIGCVPPLLKRILEDPSKHKVAQGAAQEVEALREEYGLGPQSFIDLHHIALHLKTTPRSLQGLVALFLKMRLGKEQRLTNWEQSPLTQAQIEYAALDAWASRQVLVAIRELYGVPQLQCERLLSAEAGATPPPTKELKPAFSSLAALDNRTRAAVGHITTNQPSIPPAPEAHKKLAALCIERGYVLRFDGFEAALGGYRCVFRVEYRHDGKLVAEAFRSKRAHENIRAAQNDAASEALLRLKPSVNDSTRGSAPVAI